MKILDGMDMVSMRDEYTGGFNKATAEVFRKHNVVARSDLKTGSVETMLGLVASGMGVAIVSAAVRFMLLSGVVLRPLAPDFVLESLFVAWRRDRGELPVIRSFREHVTNAGLSFTISDKK